MDLLTDASDKYFEAYNYLYDKLTTLSDDINNSEADFEKIALLVSEIRSLFESLIESFNSLIKEIRINLIYLTSNELLAGYKNYIFKCFDYSEIEVKGNLSDKKVLDDYSLNGHDITPDNIAIIASDVVSTNSNIMEDMKERIIHEFEYEKNLRNEDYSSNVKRPHYGKKTIIYESFDEVFKPEFKTKIGAFLKLLLDIDKPAINEDYLFTGTDKGVISIWFNALEEKGIVNKQSNDVHRAYILNRKFTNYNVSESHFRADRRRAIESYKSFFNDHISAIKTQSG